MHAHARTPFSVVKVMNRSTPGRKRQNVLLILQSKFAVKRDSPREEN